MSLGDQVVSRIGGAEATTLEELRGYMMGLDVHGMQQLQTDLNELITECETTLKAFGGKQDQWDQALKGKIQGNVIDYIESMKKIILAYVSSLKSILAVANEAAHYIGGWEQSVGTQAVAGTAENIQSMAQSIQTEANNEANKIDIDDLGYN